MESQRTHLYINGARFIRGVRPRPYSHASKDEKYNMLNYVSIPLHGRPVMVDGELDYARPLGKEALENKVEQYDPMIRTIQEASRAPIEEEYLHIQRQGHKAMSIKHASGFQGKQGSSSRDQGR